MEIERIEEIQKTTAHPNSVSVQQALLTVWNECEQSLTKENEELRADVERLELGRETDEEVINQLEARVKELEDKLNKNHKGTKGGAFTRSCD